MSGFQMRMYQNTIIMNDAIARGTTPTESLSKL